MRVGCGVRGGCWLECDSGACPNSHCVQRYPALSQEGCNDLIEFFVVAVNALSVKMKKTKVVLPCELFVV